ncbi:MAG: LytTR family transcriptional regulator DNA-binding domain-containing protein [Defluviitaleaceae bacterium]|nr:LytTR family transcriptional regulator DNA-binding domain-containing protein [Defluviitaleaceae bacterium]
MKIILNENICNTETEIIINCRKKDEEILRIIAGLRMLEKKITGSHNSRTFILNVSDILYVETVDRKTFIYTAKQVYETPLKLYELEERLAGEDFIRITKSCVLNFSKVKSLRMDFGGRMICTLENGEKVTVSRQYAIVIKQKLDALKGELS